MNLIRYCLFLFLILSSSTALACELNSRNLKTYRTQSGSQFGDAGYTGNIRTLNHPYRCIRQNNGRILLRHGANFQYSSWVSVDAFSSIQYYNPAAGTPGYESQINLPTPGLAEHEQAIFDQATETIGDLDFGPPTCDCQRFGHSCRFSNTPFSRYGTRPHRIANGRSSLHHKGCDIGGPAGAPVVAIEAGTVIFARENGGYGKAVWIEHRSSSGDHVISKYNHLQKIDVTEGQAVEKSEQIGTIGSTGVSTGPHLHVEIHDQNRTPRANFGQTVDPAEYLNLTAENLSRSCDEVRASNIESGPRNGRANPRRARR